MDEIKKWLEPKESLLFYCDGAVEGHVNKFGQNPFPNPNVQGGMIPGKTAITDLRVFGVSGGVLGGGRMMFEWITDYTYATARVKGNLQYEGRAIPKGKSPKDLGSMKNPFGGGSLQAIIHVASDAELVTRKSLISTDHTIGVNVAMLRTGVAKMKADHPLLSKVGMMGTHFYELHELKFNKPVVKETGSSEENVSNAYDVVLAVVQKQLRSMSTDKIDKLYSLAENTSA
ncbi:MAG: hypothetical protein M1286_01475 [Candidatus Marsarchaeota archaeon]|nr:hypothetical protein [Candidatus Marsarchaeota archaeon]